RAPRARPAPDPPPPGLAGRAIEIASGSGGSARTPRAVRPGRDVRTGSGPAGSGATAIPTADPVFGRDRGTDTDFGMPPTSAGPRASRPGPVPPGERVASAMTG